MAKKNSSRQVEPDLSNIAEPLRQLAEPLEGLVEDPSNARTHSEKNLRAIAGSLTAYGQRTPIVVNATNGVIEKGNGTFLAAKSLGWSHLAVVRVEDDPATQTGYAIADNRTGELASWDDAVLSEQLKALEESELDLNVIGFEAEDLSELEKRVTGAMDDTAATEVPPNNYVEQYGVIVVCEDESKQAETYERLNAEGYNCKVVTT